MQQELSLVTGANGHLGFNLSRLLLAKGITLRATYRSIKNKSILDSLGCEMAHADIMDPSSLAKAFKGVKKIYAVGAAFKMWSKNPKEEIYENNVQGTQNLFEAAAHAGVQDIVYVSSVAALDFTKLPAKEANGYNTDRRNWYYNSKNDSDRLALELGKKYGIRTVLVLPSAMIGGEAHRLSYSNQLVWQALQGKIPVDTNITLNWIDVKDVAKGCHAAMVKGRDGERYTLATPKHTSLQDTVRIAAEIYPELGLRIPKKVPKALLYVTASFMELASFF